MMIHPVAFFALLLALLAGLTAPAAADPLPIHPVFDSACTTAQDLRTGSMAHVEIRNQARELSCYAESGAQMIDAWRFSRGGETHYAHQTSGFALALRANSDFLGTGVARPELSFLGPLGGSYALGEACLAVEAALEHGSCDARAVITSLDGMSLTDTVAAIRRYYDDYQASPLRGSLRESVRVIASGEESPRTLAARALERRLSSLRRGLRVPASELGPLLDEPQTIRFLEGVMTRACTRGHLLHPSPEPDCVREPLVTAEEAYVRILRRLRRGGQPPAVGFCAAFLRLGRAAESGDWAGLPAAARALDVQRCATHQALVLAARRHATTGKCQFLIRNSEGPSCSGFSSDWECDGPDLWVDAQNLSYNAYMLSVLE